MRKNENVFVCPECLAIDCSKYSEEFAFNKKCQFCDSEDMIDTELSWNSFFEKYKYTNDSILSFLGDTAHPDEKLIKMREKIMKARRDVSSAQAEARNAQFEQVKASGVAYCPICHSTSVQAVTRKWRPLTGFMTNKIDRVCLKCGHKW